MRGPRTMLPSEHAYPPHHSERLNIEFNIIVGDVNFKWDLDVRQ